MPAPVNALTPEIVGLTPGQFLIWCVSVAEAPSLSDSNFLLWYREVQRGSHKLGADAAWAAVRERLAQIGTR